MNKILQSLPLLALLGCDPVYQEAERVEFRGDPQALYLTQYEANIDLAAFAKMVMHCDGLEKLKLAVTWSAYTPNAGQPDRVMGFGFSVLSKGPLADCYEQLMLDLGAHP